MSKGSSNLCFVYIRACIEHDAVKTQTKQTDAQKISKMIVSQNRQQALTNHFGKFFGYLIGVSKAIISTVVLLYEESHFTQRCLLCLYIMAIVDINYIVLHNPMAKLWMDSN